MTEKKYKRVKNRGFLSIEDYRAEEYVIIDSFPKNNNDEIRPQIVNGYNQG